MLRRLIIPIPNIHRPAIPLLSPHHKNEIIQLQLARTNLLLHRVARDVDVGVETFGSEYGLHVLDVVVYGGHDGDDEDLAGGEPEGPAAGEVFG